ncbi:Uncharacterised protein [Serratia odorifera]|uniref:Uncharacterized protein n=1 Tax=Serratia odorifera TaxID=618 RepID=A0A447KLM6_SEROD|nr:hypothetical protein [Serratia odorifera]VDZ52395.1 Uncharacterised protein [Serratia odorifera]
MLYWLAKVGKTADQRAGFAAHHQKITQRFGGTRGVPTDAAK